MSSSVASGVAGTPSTKQKPCLCYCAMIRYRSMAHKVRELTTFSSQVCAEDSSFITASYSTLGGAAETSVDVQVAFPEGIKLHGHRNIVW